LEAVLAGVYLGIFGTLLPYKLFASAVKTEKAASLGAMPYTLVITAPLLLLRREPPGLEAVLAGVYLGIFGTLLPYKLFASAVKTVRGSRASVIATLEPVLAAVWGLLLFGQAPDSTALSAYVLITAAALLASLEGRPARARSP
jgi:drug/metabolite transporter (DMT)-like permease